MTRLAIGLCVALYVLVAALSGGMAWVAQSPYSLIRFGAMFPPYVSSGEWWRLVTAVFLHGDITHILFNAYGLWMIGPLIENSFGKARFWIMFMVSGVVSTLCSFLWGSVALGLAKTVSIPFLFTTESVSTFVTPSVGMSGALTGLIGVGIAAGHKVKNPMGLEIRNQLLRWMGMILVFGLLMPGIDNAAHLGGFFAGLVVGYLFPLKDRAGRVGGWIFGGGALAMAGVWVTAFGLHAASIPREYPNDVAAYPTGIFGKTLREGGDESDIRALVQACVEAGVEVGKTPEGSTPDPKQVEKTVAYCGELEYIIPMEPRWYALHALGLHAQGDQEKACAKIELAVKIAKTGIRPSRNNQSEERIANVRQIQEGLGCRSK